MARPKRSTAGRQSRNWGEVSGVSFQTMGSGTTIDQQGIQTMGGWLPSGFLAGSGAGASSGSGLLMCAGVTEIPVGGKIFNAATFGMTTLDAVICSGSTGRAGTTPIHVCVDRGGGAPWNSAATECRFMIYGAADPDVAISASVHYFVIGQ